MIYCRNFVADKTSIAMNDEQQLTFQLGITSVPSDATCDDNGLAECIGMVYDEGEHRVIQKPVVSFTVTSGHTLLYIHKIVTTENKITMGPSYALYCNGTSMNFTASSANVMIESVGNTLIIKDGDKINYFLWNPSTSSYNYLGDSLPEVELKFSLQNASSPRSSRKEHGDCMYFSGDNPYPRDQSAYNELVVGLYEKNKRTIFRNACFVNPFFIRYALELFDGSYTHVSPPILMLPSVHQNSYAYYFNGEALKDVTLYTEFCYLRYEWMNPSQDLTPWKDIIKNVVVFATDEIDVYDLAEDQIPQSKLDYNQQDKVWRDGVYYTLSEALSKYRTSNTYGSQTVGAYFLPLTKQSATEIKNNLEKARIFYKIFSAGTSPSSGKISASSRIEKYTLENITEQERLPDDYYSHCPLSGDIFTYNNRLLLSHVKRGFYKGAGHFTSYEQSAQQNWAIDVTINTPSGNKTVRRLVTTNEHIGSYYFYYPDPRATQAKIYCGSSLVYTLNLKEHPGLNGAYWFGNLPSSEIADVTGSGTPSAGTDPDKEVFSNQVWVSEVNNPFVFKAEGNITVGNGSIIGLSSLTQALSQGQFGQYPLIIFSTDGIWAASTGSTGLFTAVHPMSREVALLNNPCITQTDGAVFFASKKGLMVVVGNEVKCVSEQLGGAVAVLDNQSESFVKFLTSAVVAYDYRDSLLWIMKDNGTMAWIYSIKSGAFAHYELEGPGEGQSAVDINVVNNYPDSLIQIGTDVYSLTGRPDINEDGTTTVVNNENVFTPNTYSASLVTRAMKFGNGIALKNIMRMKQVMQLHGENGALSVRILAKNELSDVWHELSHLRGTPWKYYQLRYTFTDLLATDRFGGTMLITQTRRTNKLR